LLHWAGAAVVTKLLALPVPDMDKGSPELFFTTLPLALLSSYLVHRVIERPLEAVRARTRQTSAQT
jgi:peptidoglycan/LPS O-acetylase OafA/YrhL